MYEHIQIETVKQTDVTGGEGVRSSEFTFHHLLVTILSLRTQIVMDLSSDS